MTFNPSNGSSEFSRYSIVPEFSSIRSRSQVSLRSDYYGLEVPVVSANMASISGAEMCEAMKEASGAGVLHRFMSIEDNIALFKSTGAWVSCGITPTEMERAVELYRAGAQHIIIDVAHGAQMAVVEFYNALKAEVKGNARITVGNFASADSVAKFKALAPSLMSIKVGIGPGATCTTRFKTGVGYPQVLAVHDIHEAKLGVAIISDGGHMSPGDIAKSLAAGADAVMIGSMLASTKEAAGKGEFFGSASQKSYNQQGKASSFITAEGIEKTVEVNTTVAEVMHDIAGGLRSSFSYVGAANLQAFHRDARILDNQTGQFLNKRSTRNY